MFLNVVLSHLKQIDNKINSLFPEFRSRSFKSINRIFTQRMELWANSQIALTVMDQNLMFVLNYFSLMQSIQTKLEEIYAALHNKITCLTKASNYSIFWITINSKIVELINFLNSFLQEGRVLLLNDTEKILIYKDKKIKYNSFSNLYIKLESFKQYLLGLKEIFLIIKGGKK